MLNEIRKLAVTSIIKNKRKQRRKQKSTSWELPTETASADNTRVAPTPAINFDFPRLTITYPEARVDTYQRDTGGYGGLFGQPALDLRREHATENYERYYDDLPDWNKKLHVETEAEHQNPTPINIYATRMYPTAGSYDHRNREIELSDIFFDNFLDLSELPITNRFATFFGATPKRSIPPSVLMNIDSPYAFPLGEVGYSNGQHQPIFERYDLLDLFSSFQHEMGHVVSSNASIGATPYNYSSIDPEYSPNDGVSRHDLRPSEIYPMLQTGIIDLFRASGFVGDDLEKEYKLLNTPQGIDWIISNPSIWWDHPTSDRLIPKDWLWLKEKYPKAYWRNIPLPGTTMSEGNQQNTPLSDLGLA